MGRAQWLAKWFFGKRILTAFSSEEVAAGSYRHMHNNSKRVYRGILNSSQTNTYGRSNFELPRASCRRGPFSFGTLHHRPWLLGMVWSAPCSMISGMASLSTVVKIGVSQSLLRSLRSAPSFNDSSSDERPETFKQIPSSTEARADVAERSGSVQRVQREISRCEPLLSQLTAEAYTGSSPRVAVSEKVMWGSKKERASRTSADAAFVSANAALRSGFFSSARLTACWSVIAEGCCACCAWSCPETDKASRTTRKACARE
jgi:hypothetical protein